MPLPKRGGLSRDEALSEMHGTDFLNRRRSDMEATMARHEQLLEDLNVLNNASPFQRVINALRFRDGELFSATRAAFQPAVPVTIHGMIFAGAGFFVGWWAIVITIAVLLWPLRRRRRAAA